MSTPRLSLIIASRQRPRALARCLTAVGQQDGVTLQVIVVACPDGCAAARQHPLAPDLTVLPFDRANLAEARNLGLSHARAEIVGFVDDDAVPEPTWARALLERFQDPNVQMAGGRVLGRNGISTQWGQRWIDPWGRSLPHPDTTAAPRTEGTNMALRRDLVDRIGGFDPVFAFFHDDTDLNMRAGSAEYVPDAVVHHGFAAGPFRRRDRVPRSLFQIGQSQMAFLRKHAPKAEHAAAWAGFAQDQRQRLERHLISGALEPRDFRRLWRELEAGRRQGADMALPAPPIPEPAKDPDRWLPARATAPRYVLVGRPRHRRQLHRRACELVAQGAVVTVFCLSLTTLYHQIRYRPEGYWLQTGGVYGRSERTGPLVQWMSMQRRVRAECDRQAAFRGLDHAVTLEYATPNRAS